jgi:hypothetical protein
MGHLWVLAALLMAADGVMTEPVRFATVAAGNQSGIEGTRTVVVRTAEEWKALWADHAPGDTPPPIDFSAATVLGVFAGYRSTGGHRVEITSVARAEAGLVVTWHERRPPRDAIVTQVLTFPFHLVSVPRHAGEVTFRRADSQ